MAQTLGIIEILWRGNKVPVEKGSSFRLGGLKNNAVVTGRAVDRAQEMEPSEIKGITKLERGKRLLDIIGSGDEGELQVLADTGHTYIWPDAFLTNRPTATSGEGGKVELIWMGGEAEELISG